MPKGSFLAGNTAGSPNGRALVGGVPFRAGRLAAQGKTAAGIPIAQPPCPTRKDLIHAGLQDNLAQADEV